ncbi:DUF3137 domain-containing protein [bacterium]|nr:MAG: DUF3137 domain-containing protein [bacterium]
MGGLLENESIIFAGFFVLFSCIPVLVLYLAVRQRRKLRKSFAFFAERLGCPASIPTGFFGGFPSLNGVYRKRSLRVYMFSRSSGSGKNRRSKTYTAFTLHVDNPDDFQFNVYEQGFFTTLLTKFGMQDISIGDEAFDKEFIVKSNNEEKIRSMLSPMLLTKFMDFAERYTAFGVELKGDRFYYEAPETIIDEKHMLRYEEKINFMCDISDRLDEMNRRRRN